MPVPSGSPLAVCLRFEGLLRLVSAQARGSNITSKEEEEVGRDRPDLAPPRLGANFAKTDASSSSLTCASTTK
jgi:hypothetical protein